MKTLLLIAALAAAPLAAHAQAAPAAAATPAAKTGQGVGVVKSIDAKAGTVVLHHGPVAALGWPAMTMPFKADPKLLQGLKAGQKVKFTVVDGETPEVTAIAGQ